MHDRPELLRHRRIRIIGAQVDVVGFVTVGAPVPLVLTRIGVVDDHASIPVPVRHIRFVSGRIHNDIGGHVEVLSIVAVLFLIRAADLQQEFASLVKSGCGTRLFHCRNPDVVL